MVDPGRVVIGRESHTESHLNGSEIGQSIMVAISSTSLRNIVITRETVMMGVGLVSFQVLPLLSQIGFMGNGSWIKNCNNLELTFLFYTIYEIN